MMNYQHAKPRPEILYILGLIKMIKYDRIWRFKICNFCYFRCQILSFLYIKKYGLFLIGIARNL
jgi:hypothetical protein